MSGYLNVVLQERKCDACRRWTDTRKLQWMKAWKTRRVCTNPTDTGGPAEYVESSVHGLVRVCPTCRGAWSKEAA